MTDFKLKHPKVKVVPKDQFPKLLKKTWDQLNRADNRGKHDLKVGFRTCGIVPCDRRPVIRKIDKTVTTLGEAVMTYMKDLRHPDEPTKKGRKRKVTTAPGLSISADDLVQPSAEETTTTKNFQKTSKTSSKQKVKTKSKC